MKNKLKAAAAKVKSTRGTGKRLIETYKANKATKKVNKAVDIHMKNVAGDKRSIAHAKKVVSSKEYGPYQKMGARKTLSNPKTKAKFNSSLSRMKKSK